MFFTSNHSVLYNTVVCSAKRFWSLQKQLDHNNLFSFDLCSYVFVKGSPLPSSAVDGDVFLNAWKVSAFPFSAIFSWQLWLGVLFFYRHWCLSCVHTALVIHVPTIKHQHKAISQCNRFVSSLSRSPGGPISGPSGPWLWFREKEGGKKQGVTGNC